MSNVIEFKHYYKKQADEILNQQQNACGVMIVSFCMGDDGINVLNEAWYDRENNGFYFSEQVKVLAMLSYLCAKRIAKERDGVKL